LKWLKLKIWGRAQRESVGRRRFDWMKNLGFLYLLGGEVT